MPLTRSQKLNEHQNSDLPASLSALPAELKYQIAKDSSLSEKDLLNLRLASKAFLPYATEAVSRKRLLNTRFFLGPSGLGAYKTLSAGSFGPHLRFAVFDDERIRDGTRHGILPMQRIHHGDASKKTLTLRIKRGNLSMRHFDNAMLMAGDFELVKLFFDGGHFKPQRWSKLDKMLTTAQTGCVRVLSLSHLRVPAQTLTQFIGHHQDTIDKISINRCTFRGSWQNTFRWIEVNVTTIRSIDHFDESTNEDDPAPKGTFTCFLLSKKFGYRYEKNRRQHWNPRGNFWPVMQQSDRNRKLITWPISSPPAQDE